VREFTQLLHSGRVWLLLDAAEEMAVTDPLPTLAKQLGAPLWKNVPVVLTCRVNVWDELGNPLSEFDTYKLLDLGDGDSDEPPRQKLFIDKFFAPSQSESSEWLWAVLNERGNKRIKDLVLNPLRLLLLCETWLSGSSQLPNTKVQLYDNFVDALYRLRQQEEFYTKQDQRLNLKAALGHLALRALDLGEGSLLPYHLVDLSY
jgi:predicted NACHT family NTPase